MFQPSQQRLATQLTIIALAALLLVASYVSINVVASTWPALFGPAIERQVPAAAPSGPALRMTTDGERYRPARPGVPF